MTLNVSNVGCGRLVHEAMNGYHGCLRVRVNTFNSKG
jgi:hypothetical protein